MIVILILVIIYLIGIVVTISTDTVDGVSFHETGGIFGGPTSSHDNRKATKKDVQMALIWPLRFTVYMVLSTLWVITEIPIRYLMLLFGSDVDTWVWFKKLNRLI